MALKGIQLVDAAWAISGDYSLSGVLRALPVIAPVGAMLYLECDPPQHVSAFLHEHSVASPTTVYPGTIAPKLAQFHVAATPVLLSQLAALADPEDAYEGEICVHMVLYRDSQVILSGYDFGSLELLLDPSVPENAARLFATLSGGVFSAAV